MTRNNQLNTVLDPDRDVIEYIQKKNSCTIHFFDDDFGHLDTISLFNSNGRQCKFHITNKRVTGFIDKLEDLPPIFSRLRFLTHYENEQENSPNLPKILLQMHWIQSLNLSHKKLTHVPEELLSFPRLSDLDLSSNRISDFSNLSQIKSLKSLNLSNNYSNFFSEEIFQLRKLESLDLMTNRLYHVPSKIRQLHNLKRLALSFNKLVDLPQDLQHLPLTDFFLSDNLFQECPSWIGNMPSLKLLHIGNCSLSNLPLSFKHLRNLEDLALHNTNLTSFPEEILNFRRLSTFTLFDNFIQSLPKNFGKLIQLRELGLSNCGLSELPPSMRNLSQLELLDLEWNFFTEFPDLLYDLPRLKMVGLQNNSWKDWDDVQTLNSEKFFLYNLEFESEWGDQPYYKKLYNEDRLHEFWYPGGIIPTIIRKMAQNLPLTNQDENHVIYHPHRHYLLEKISNFQTATSQMVAHLLNAPGPSFKEFAPIL
jgi:Leucine-rich repeat (LRR) protein